MIKMNKQIDVLSNNIDSIYHMQSQFYMNLPDYSK
jgi:hypothetical protein